MRQGWLFALEGAVCAACTILVSVSSLTGCDPIARYALRFSIAGNNDILTVLLPNILYSLTILINSRFGTCNLHDTPSFTSTGGIDHESTSNHDPLSVILLL